MIVRPNRHADRRRGAASLIEVVASLTITAVLFGTTATMTALLFRLDRLGRAELAAAVIEGRLAADLRDDVHAAVRIDPEGPADGLGLIGPDGGVTSYRSEGGALVRRRRDADGTGRVETYRLLPGGSARWERGDRLVVLVLDAPGVPRDPEGRRRVARVEAAIGRDHRFEGGGS